MFFSPVCSDISFREIRETIYFSPRYVLKGKYSWITQRNTRVQSWRGNSKFAIPVSLVRKNKFEFLSLASERYESSIQVQGIKERGTTRRKSQAQRAVAVLPCL